MMDKMELRRPQQAAPTEPGWYYGRFLLGNTSRSIEPYWVGGPTLGPDQYRLSIMVGDSEYFRPDFDWFGPVPECIEATVPA
jgi:hypothetical protein